MAMRPAFFVAYDIKVKNFKENIIFKWYPGFSLKQKQKSIQSMHKSIVEKYPNKKILEISTKSPQKLGVCLSAFNLKIKNSNFSSTFTVESAFQSSKVFEYGGPYRDILNLSSIDAKKDKRLKNSGKLKKFDFSGNEWELEPKTAFYNWLYIKTLSMQTKLINLILEYDIFTDIEFNPNKSINCQAEAVALFVSLYKTGLLKKALESKESFLECAFNLSKNKESKQISMDIKQMLVNKTQGGNMKTIENPFKNFINDYTSNGSNICMDEKAIERLTSLGIFYNKLHSESDAGNLFNRGSFESTFHIKWYIDNDLDFIIQLFANHTKGHLFYNGNKRTAVEIFKYFINNFSPLKIKKGIKIENYQKDFIDERITKNQFTELIFQSLEIRPAKSTDKVKLESLIPRAEVTSDKEVNNLKKNNITLKDLKKDDLFFKLLRKPYFQRDTNSWDLSKVDNILNSFTENMLIPAVILWNSSDDGIFIVDGAHRLSALAAWVNDDYGSELDYSKHLQIKNFIENKYKNYDELCKSNSVTNNKLLNTLATKAINIEWITGDYSLVKNSFIRINEQGVAITLDEKEIIKNDEKPPAIIARTILSYSGGQIINHQDKVTNKIYEMLFLPMYSKVNKVVPMAGSLYADFIISKVYNFIKTIEDEKEYDYVALLNKTYNILDLIVNKLELNNRVYFYGVTYQFKQSAFVGITRLIMKLYEEDNIKLFSDNREKFEKYLVDNPEHIQIIVRKKRHVKNSMDDLQNYYLGVLEYISTGKNKILKEKFSYLSNNKKTDKMKKIEEKYKQEIELLIKCKICGGYINNFSNSTVHKFCKGE